MRFFLPSFFFLAACSSSNAPSGSAGDGGHDTALEVGADASGSEAPASDAARDVTVDAALDGNKAAPCAASFGDALTNAFGRLDGTVLAIVPPKDQACAMPNMTHLVIQVTSGGVVYRMVVDVLSDSLLPDGSDPDVSFYGIDAPLADGDWAEGWHPGVNFDYVSTLNVHSPSFVPMSQADLVAKVTSEIALGSKISVFATSMDDPTSAHLVHRNVTNQDGAIVLGPETKAPHYLLFRFYDQSF